MPSRSRSCWSEGGPSLAGEALFHGGADLGGVRSVGPVGPEELIDAGDRHAGLHHGGELHLMAAPGKRIQLLFHIQPLLATFEGWYIDDVTVQTPFHSGERQVAGQNAV